MKVCEMILNDETTTCLSYRPMVCVQGEWVGNGLRFATEEEARRSAVATACRWTLVDDYRTDQSNDPVNYAIVDECLVEISA